MRGAVPDGASRGVQRDSWRWRDIKWKELWARQDYANFCLTACLIVATAVVSTLASPHIRPYVLWDARIAMPMHSELDTIPSWVAVFVPLIMLALTVAVGEFRASRRLHNSVTDAVSSAIFFFLDGVQSFIMGILLTQVFKYIVGRLRPNFLARCIPAVPADAVFTLQNITQAINPADQYPCSGDAGTVEEGRLAFPSGHTSACFNLAVYASAYLIWVWHWRHPCSARKLSFWQEFKSDLFNVLAKTWMLAMLCFAWGVGISRIIDYQHDVSDVLGGAFIGTMIALVYILRAIPRWGRVLASDGGAALEGSPPVLTSDNEELRMLEAGYGAAASSSKQHRSPGLSQTELAAHRTPAPAGGADGSARLAAV